MKKKMINRHFNKILILSLVLLMSGTYMLLHASPPTDEELLVFYHEHRAELKKVVSLCKTHPALEQIRINADEDSFYENLEKYESFKTDLDDIHHIMTAFQIPSIACNRVAGEEYKFSGVTFYLYTREPVKGIAFDIASYRSPTRFDQGLMDAGPNQRINDQGWSLFNFK